MKGKKEGRSEHCFIVVYSKKRKAQTRSANEPGQNSQHSM